MKLLLVEDEFQQRQLIRTIIEQNTEHTVTDVASVEEAITLLQSEPFDTVLSDWKLPGKDGLFLLQYIKENLPYISFILATAYGSISHAVSAIRAGADDYLNKPFEKQQLLFTLEKIADSQQLKQENKQLKTQVQTRDRLGNIVGRSEKMQQLFRKIERVSDSNVTVLINGESGTGKELVAKALHDHSERKHQAFIPINCSAIPESLAEAELFGSEKGAYTGAHQRKIGMIEAANKGTLFLDEIADLPLSIQPKLLRFLQEGKISRVGSHQEIEVDVRVIAASHKSLAEQVANNEFREDLFYRLNIVPLSLPPLRDRKEDIPALLDHFCELFAQKHKRKPIQFEKAALKRMLDHSWPGNIRELSNCCERLTVLADDSPITTEDLPFSVEVSSQLPFKTFELDAKGIDWEAHEKQVLQQALELSQNNRTQAAKLLAMSYKAFLYRLEKHQIEILK